MEISQHPRDGGLTLELKGRFDANWADYVGNAIESAIRAGHHHIDLDLAQVKYVSSAGIRIVVKYFKQLRSVHGALRILHPTETVLSVLELSGIADRLVAGPPAPQSPGAAEAAGPRQTTISTPRWERNGV